MKIKGNEVTRKDENSATVTYFGQECKVHLRSVQIGGNTETPITQEDSTITMGVAVESPTGEIELINKTLRTTASEVGITAEMVALFRTWFIAEVCGEHSVEDIGAEQVYSI